MYVNPALVVRRPKVQLLPLFKGRSGHQSIITAKTQPYISQGNFSEAREKSGNIKVKKVATVSDDK